MVFTHRFICIVFALCVALSSNHTVLADLHNTATMALEDAPADERTTIDELLGSSAWPRRVIALMRLQRFDCAESASMLTLGLDDPQPQVRSFATLILAHRRIPQEDKWFKDERNPKVIRNALRAGYEIDSERLTRGVASLSRSSVLDDKMTAAELALAAKDAALRELATELIKTVILRMDDSEAGSLSPRLTRVTSGEDVRRDFRWRNWYRKHRNDLGLKSGGHFPPQMKRADDEPLAKATPSIEELPEVAKLDLDEFIVLAQHLEALASKPLDLAIVIDCTASMSGEIADAQGGVDDLMMFAADVCKGIRVGVAGYRDRRSKDFEQIGWDLTPSVAQAREHLWKLSALGGGDRPELVDKGLELAYKHMSWNPEHRGIVVLVGDAPPHPGRGKGCITMARSALALGVKTHVIGCDPLIQDSKEEDNDATEEVIEPGEKAYPSDIVEGAPVTTGPSRRRRSQVRQAIEFFPEIAAAGEGRVVNLDRNERLVPEIAGLIVGEDFEEPLVEFFTVYLQLCQ